MRGLKSWTGLRAGLFHSAELSRRHEIRSITRPRINYKLNAREQSRSPGIKTARGRSFESPKIPNAPDLACNCSNAANSSLFIPGNSRKLQNFLLVHSHATILADLPFMQRARYFLWYPPPLPPDRACGFSRREPRACVTHSSIYVGSRTSTKIALSC